ncbi:thioesterase II family protein [Streptomyces sp. JJ36]|uniref:thioesterase II family protein n=1 Tax=Streptomyces sp. JJ36 TaxID=2736645 RepID=UPI001F283F78|nr:alpha/beta fold hydrolase [Streptomyces sp. JJ36]MCF6522535.1 thioesterase [Streptomyces sp. JJ36]
MQRSTAASGVPAATGSRPLQLFCFPYAGGSARIFSGWESALPAHVRLRAVEPAGRGSRFRERPHDRIETLTQDLLPTLLAARDAPYALFGYSLGALVAYELARIMEQRYGCPPLHLCVGAFRAPHLKRSAVPDYNLPEAEFRERLRAFNGTPDAVLADDSLMELVIPLLRADLAVADTYRHTGGRPLSCPITAFAGSGDEEVPLPAVAQWERHTAAAFALTVLDGDHFFIHQQESALLGHLSAALTRGEGGGEVR